MRIPTSWQLSSRFEALLRIFPLLYLACTVPLLIALCWLTPPFQTPDEYAHLERADQIAHAILIGHRQNGTSGGVSHLGIVSLQETVKSLPFHPDARMKAAWLALARKVAWGGPVFLSAPNTAQYPPFFYLPEALALRVAQMKNLSVLLSLDLARIVNALIAALLTAFAIHVARRSKPLLSAIGLLPMTLYLYASASQDALLLACSLLPIGLLDRIAADERDATPKEIVAVAVFLAMVTMARPPYIPLCLCCLLLEKRPGLKSIGSMLLVAGACGGWSILSALIATVAVHSANPSAQMAFVLSHPMALFHAFNATWISSGEALINEMVGVLGWIDTVLPEWYYMLARNVLVLALIALLGGRSRKPSVAVCAVVCSLIALATTQYIAWSIVGSATVDGLQGRYLLPVLATCALAIPGSSKLTRLQRPAYAGVVILALVTPFVIIQTLVSRYYLG